MIQGKTKKFTLKICNNFISRLIGNCFKRRIDKVLCFPKCNGIHTLFMFRAIDVVMLNKEKCVKYVYNNFKPWRIILPKKDIYYTIEFPKDENIYKIDDFIEF